MDLVNKKNIVILVVIIIVAIGGYFWWSESQKPGALDDFAKCLNDKGLKFYGAFWCPHCQNQKKLFSNSVKYLPYIECSTPDGNNQLQVCNDANIQGYPTWEFPDKSRQQGEMTLKELADKSGCQLPN